MKWLVWHISLLTMTHAMYEVYDHLIAKLEDDFR